MSAGEVEHDRLGVIEITVEGDTRQVLGGPRDGQWEIVGTPTVVVHLKKFIGQAAEADTWMRDVLTHLVTNWDEIPTQRASGAE